MKLKVGTWYLPLPLSIRYLLLLFVIPLACQLWMAQQVDVTFDGRRTTVDGSKVPSLSTNSTHASASNPHPHNENKKVPKIFIGILGDTSRQMGLEYRNKQRQLFAIWNDTRLCHLTKALRLLEEHGNNTDNNDHCQVIYSFIVGAHNSSSSVLPYHLGNDDARPLTLSSIPLLPRFKDVNRPDVTILNIRENMNDGKTPTFVHFALQDVAFRLGVSYIVKCDSDAALRWNALLRFLHVEFPTPPISTVIGMFRHKAFWSEGRPEDEGEQLWNQEWYGGMHLYLAGQLYVMSVNVAERLVEEARRWYTPTSFVKAPYFAGHEDHDALSLVQQPPQQTPQEHPEYTATNVIRWVGIAKHVTFWEHPVKGEGRWERILKRERTQAKERLEGTRPGLFTEKNQDGSTGGDSGGKSSGNKSQRWRPSLVVLFLESPSNVSQQRENYLQEWTRRNGGGLDRVCGYSQYVSKLKEGKSRDGDCDLYHIFVMGTNSGRAVEQLSGFSPIETNQNTWELPVRHNLHRGLGLSVLSYIHEHVPDFSTQLDYIVLVQAKTTFLSVSKWKHVADAQPAENHSVVMGQMRDKHQNFKEFGPYKYESHWRHEHDNIHLYLASDLIGLGSSLVGKIVDQAKANITLRAQYSEENLGHDLTTLAYLGPRAILHWVPITKSMQFWETIET